MKKTFLLIAISAFVFFFTSCTPEAVPCFNASSDAIDDGNNPIVGEKIIFENCSEDADTYFWDFGDGETSTSENPKYAYEEGGEYTVTLEATNKKGTETLIHDIEVLSVSGKWDGHMIFGTSEWDFEIDIEQIDDEFEGEYTDDGGDMDLESGQIDEYEISFAFSTNQQIFSDDDNYYDVIWSFEGELNDDYDEIDDGIFKLIIEGSTYTDDSFTWVIEKTSSKSGDLESNKIGINTRSLVRLLKK